MGLFNKSLNLVAGALGFEGLSTEAVPEKEIEEDEGRKEDKKALWGSLKDMVGKDVTSFMSLPISFFEPTTTHQRIVESFEFHDLIVSANESEDPMERLALVAAFYFSPYYCSARPFKPFNPILGETLEVVDESTGLQVLMEQVSHHPPVYVGQATVEGSFKTWIRGDPKTKFLGNKIEVFPGADLVVQLDRHPKDLISVSVPSTIAHNIIIGGMWIDNYGDLEVTNHATGEKCVLTFKKCGWLGADYRQVHGHCFDAEGAKKMVVKGQWGADAELMCTPCHPNGEPMVGAGWRTLFRAPKLPDTKYLISQYLIDMNKVSQDPKEACLIAPSDGRFRPDMQGLISEDAVAAGEGKRTIEERQRACRKKLKEEGREWRPVHFKEGKDEATGLTLWEYVGNYWEKRAERKQQLEAGTLEAKAPVFSPSLFEQAEGGDDGK